MKATDYLAREVQRLGLTPAGENGTFFQTLPLKTRRVDRMSSFIAGGASLAIGTDWAIGGNTSLDLDGVEVIYAGPFGETAAALSADQVKGRIVAYAPEASNAALLKSLEGAAITPEGAAGVVFLLPPRTAGVMGYALRGGSQLIDPSCRNSKDVCSSRETAAAKLFHAGQPTDAGHRGREAVDQGPCGRIGRHVPGTECRGHPAGQRREAQESVRGRRCAQ